MNGELRTGRPIDREILSDATGVISIAVQVIYICMYTQEFESFDQRRIIMSTVYYH